MVDRNREPLGNTAANQSTGSTGAEAKEQVQQKAADLKEQVQQTAADVKEQVTTQATDKLSGQKDAASGSLNTVAHAFRQTGEQLRDNDQAGIADYVERAAGQVEHFAGYLSKRDIRGLAQDTEQFARREPALFLGGAFALGIFAARFLKSSGQGVQGAVQGNRQQPSPQVTPPPQLPAHAASAPSAVAGRQAPPTGGVGMASAGNNFGTNQGRTSSPASAAGAANAGYTPRTGSTNPDVIIGGPPLPTDVIVGGPPHEPGRGGR